MRKTSLINRILLGMLAIGCVLTVALVSGMFSVSPVMPIERDDVPPVRRAYRIGLRTIERAQDIQALMTPLGAGDTLGQAQSSNMYWETAYPKIAQALPSDKIFLLDVDWDGTPEMIASTPTDNAKTMLTQYRASAAGASVAGKATVNSDTSYTRIDLYRKGKTGAYVWLGQASSANVRRLIDQVTMKSGNLRITRLFEERISTRGGIQYFYKGRKNSKKSYTKQYRNFFKTYLDQKIDAPFGNSAAIEQVMAAFKQLDIAPIPVTKMKLNKASVTMAYGMTYTLRATVTPSYATQRTIAWSSSDNDLVSVSSTGVVTVVGYVGRATITAQAPSGAKRTCTVIVKRPAAKTVTISADASQVELGSTLQLSAEVLPVAANPAVKWTSSAKSVATVDANGVVTPLRAGTTRITATTSNRKRATVAITVTSPVADEPDVTRRAVLLAAGMKRSDFNEGAVFASDVDKMGYAMAQSTFEGNPIIVSKLNNAYASGNDALNAIVRALSDADENDVSYVYLMCHGAQPSSTRYYIRVGTGDSGALVTSAQLRTALDRVQGKIVLILSCCFSGDVIGKNAANTQPMTDFVDDFFYRGVTAKSGEFKTDKYYVLCGSSRTQVGWYSYSPTTNTGCSFLCNGVSMALGIENAWSGTGSGVWHADVNRDGAVTMQELYALTRDHVRQLCVNVGISDPSRVQVWPENSDFVVFQK